MAAQSLADSGERLLVLDLSSGSGLVNSAAAVALRSQQWWVDNGFQRLGLAAMRVNLWVPVAGGLTWVSFLLLSFFFGGLWVWVLWLEVHRWWSPAWEASLVSLLAWGWKTHVGLRGIHELPGLGWACSRSHGANTWKVVSYLAGLLFWWFCFLLVVYGCVVWTGSLFLYQNWRRTTTLTIE